MTSAGRAEGGSGPWTTVSLPDVALHFTDGPFGSNLKSSHYADEGVRVIRLQNIGVGKMRDDDLAYITREHYESLPRNHCKPGDVVIATLGDPNLRACVVPESLRESLNKADCVLLRPDRDRVDAGYLCALLNSDRTIKMASGLVRGQTRGRISMGRLKELKLPLPPLAEQKRIAGILDAADALRAKRRECLAQLDTLLQSTFLDMFGDPVTNPMGWETGSLQDVTTKITDGTHKTPKYTESGVEFLSAKDLKDGGIRWDTGKFISPEEHAQLTRRCNPERGDLLLAKSGSLGSVAIIDRDHEFSLFESLCLIKRDSEKICAPFLACMIRNPMMQVHLLGKNKGIAIKHLHLVDVRGLEIVIPPQDEQRRFAAIVQSIERQKTLQRAHLAELDTLFASLQSRAFRGDL